MSRRDLLVSIVTSPTLKDDGSVTIDMVYGFDEAQVLRKGRSASSHQGDVDRPWESIDCCLAEIRRSATSQQYEAWLVRLYCSSADLQEDFRWSINDEDRQQYARPELLMRIKGVAFYMAVI
jgi:hypothetical protein